VVFPPSPGEHRLVLQRRGYEPFKVAVSLKEGDVHRVAPEWKSSFAASNPDPSLAVSEPVPVGFEGWTQRFDAALRRAEQTNKDVLEALVGSDWDETTVRMARSVYPEAAIHHRPRSNWNWW
jgi:hypothetical protein